MSTRHDLVSYIRSHWNRAIYRDAPGKGFGGVDLPHPYTSPCIQGEGHYSFFFYWDTYFTNLGLLRHGHAGTAKDNIRNILWLIARQGYMPNHVGLYNRSQPPFLGRMIQDYVTATGDNSFLTEAVAGLVREYHFWTTTRSTPTGLERHGHHETDEGLDVFYQAIAPRLGLPLDADPAARVHLAAHWMAEAESGWDFTPRFDSRCLDHLPVDLNALLYDTESWLGDIAPALGRDDAKLWQTRATTRRERVNRHLWNDARGLFLDYDFVNRRPSAVASLATFMPLFTGLASPEQAARVAANLPLFERTHGLAATEESPAGRTLQWAFPNTWPPLVYVTVEALRRYGFETEARRIAATHLDTADRLFEKTGQLWEKTNALTGEVAGGEYQAAPMLGWSAGVYATLAGLPEGTG